MPLSRAEALRGSPRARTLFYSAGLVVGIGLVLLGVSAIPLCFVAVLPWAVFLAARLGASLAITGSLFGALLLIMALQFATTPTGLPLLPTLTVVLAGLGGAGIAALVRQPSPGRITRASATWAWLAGLPGAVVWGLTLVLANVVPGAARFSWVLMGDTANTTLIARDVLLRNGLGVGGGANPVPLTSAMLAVEMAPGRASTPDSLLARHDILAIVGLAALSIAVLCVFAGAVVALMVRSAGARQAVTIAAGSAASLLPLSWFFSGYPLEFGFLSAQPSMVVVLGAVAAHFAVRRSPVASFVVQCLAATLALAAWSPLVLVPLALATVTAIRFRSRLWRATGASRVLLWLSIAQLAAFGFGVSLPAVIDAPTSLIAPGGVFSFRHWLLPALAIAAIALALLAFRRPLDDMVVAVAATALAAGVGLAFLLFIGRNLENPWSYYPLKFSWLMATTLVVLIAGAGAAACARYVHRTWLLAVSLLLVAATTIGFLEWTPRSGAPYSGNTAVGHVIEGDLPGDGDHAAEAIFEDARPDEGHILWQSGDPLEGTINFWVWQLWANSMTDDFPLRTAAYGLYDHDSVGDLCDILDYMRAPAVTIETQSTTLAADLDATCPTEASTVTVEVR